MASDTILLGVTRDYTVKIGLPPRDRLDSFNSRAAILGKINNVSHVACSPEGELFCIRAGDLYRGPMPSNKNVDWFSVARRVGRYEWNRIKLIFFHPNGELYGITSDGAFYKGPQPDNEHLPWLYGQAKKIGTGDYNQFEAMYFDPEGILYAVNNRDKIYKGAPPSEESDIWMRSNVLVGDSGWQRLTHFMSFSPDGKLWCVDKYNGNIYRGKPPVPEDTNYLRKADYLGWSYHEFRFFAFSKDKTIHNILSFEFLPEMGEKVSELPEVLEEKIYDNRRSSSTLKHTFTFEKTIEESSSFTHEHGFTFEMGTEVSFKTGVPFISEGAVNVSMNMSTSHNWAFTKENRTETACQTQQIAVTYNGLNSQVLLNNMNSSTREASLFHHSLSLARRTSIFQLLARRTSILQLLARRTSILQLLARRTSILQLLARSNSILHLLPGGPPSCSFLPGGPLFRIFLPGGPPSCISCQEDLHPASLARRTSILHLLKGGPPSCSFFPGGPPSCISCQEDLHPASLARRTSILHLLPGGPPSCISCQEDLHPASLARRTSILQLLARRTSILQLFARLMCLESLHFPYQAAAALHIELEYENLGNVSFSSSTEVELEAGKAIKMVASVIKAEINVPYKARARTMFGSEVEINGMWRGVSHYSLMVSQEDYNK
ncbi:uncharacterized protein LOC142727830 [Rhinoderma darwinii]|uniref:uncharacterized protein LOC142727830 n=1 Tax=Rhinoderma darwinii TaxID=43563 RepID=UPI003F67A630